jgi:hypothetical protein
MTFQHLYLALVASAFGVFATTLLSASIWSKFPRKG